MTRQKTTRFSVTLRDSYGHATGDWPGFLDMLRYDQARVIDWSHQSGVEGRPPTYTAMLEVDAPRVPTTDRWASFGLHVKVIR